MLKLESARHGVNSDKVQVMRMINRFILLSVIFSSVVFISQSAQAETGLLGSNNMTKSIARLDKKKKWIQFSKMKFSYNGKTYITDPEGRKVSADALKEGIIVTIKLDVYQRYISSPVLSEIHIETFETIQ